MLRTDRLSKHGTSHVIDLAGHHPDRIVGDLGYGRRRHGAEADLVEAHLGDARWWRLGGGAAGESYGP